MKNKILRLADDLLWMMYPTLCAACNRPLFTGEDCVCTPCAYHLPKTGFHLQKDNPVVRHFWGKVPVQAATAYFFFSKGQRVQQLIHHLKYKGRKDVGDFAGRLMGHELIQSQFGDVDLIIPVPLHEKRLKERGYNQSDCFAEGLATSMNKTFSPNAVYRTKETGTQTRKHRFERYKNVENIFTIPDQQLLTGKSVLLVDDVITTGSTFISCAEAILSVPSTKVFIAAIACA